MPLTAFPIPTTALNGVSAATADPDAHLFGRQADGSIRRYPLGDLATPYNAKLWGAVGNGSTLDTSALTALFAAAPAGATVLFPPGFNCLVDAPIPLPARCTVIGYGASIKKTDVDAQEAILALAASGIEIVGLTLDGAQSGTSGTPRFEYGLIDIVNDTATALEDIHVHDCTLKNSRGCGLRIIGHVDGVHWHDNVFKNNFIHVFAEPTSTYTYKSLHGHDNRYRATWYTSTYSGAIKLKGNGAASLSPTDISLHDEKVKAGCEMGIELWDTINDSSIVNCHVDGPTFGISVDNVSNISILINKVYRNSYCGIELANQARHCLVKGNTIEEYEADGTTRGGQRGIVSSGPACHRNVIEGNFIRGVDGEAINLMDNHRVVVRGNFLYDSNILLGVKNASYMDLEDNELHGPCTYHAFLDYNDTNSTDINVVDNTLYGAAVQDNIVLYSGVSGRVVTNLTVTRNDFKSATFGNKAFNVNLPGGTTPNLQYFDNEFAASLASEFQNTTTSPELTPPYRSTLQRAGLSVAAKRRIVVATNASAQWYKVFTASLGAPLFLQLHIAGYNTPESSPTQIAHTALITAAPYGFASGIMLLPAGDYFGALVTEIVYDNPSSGATQEVWIKVAPTTSTIYLDLYFSDYPLNVVAAPTATTTEPTFAANSYRLAISGGNLKYLQAPSVAAKDRLSVGSGRDIRAILTGYGTLSLGAIAANTQITRTLTVTGVVAADAIRQPVICGFSWPLVAGLVFDYAYVSADNTVTFVFKNVTAAEITYESVDVTATVLRLIP